MKLQLPSLIILALGLASCLETNAPPPAPMVRVGGDLGYYTTLPDAWDEPYYFYNHRYYHGGRWETGRFKSNGHTYKGRYFHHGHYYYGGRYDPGHHHDHH
jgi:hypothetical protein